MKLMKLCRERRKCGNVLPLKKIKIDIFWSYNIDLEGKKNKAGFFFFLSAAGTSVSKKFVEVTKFS